MGTAEIIGAAALLAAAGICLLISIRSFKEKGFLFNNSCIWLNAVQRKQLDKKPYYRQSAVIFAILSGVFALEAAELVTGVILLRYIALALCLCAAVYAVISEVRIHRHR